MDAESGAGTQPTTLSQAGIFFAEEKALTDGAYNVCMRVDVRGRIVGDQLVGACRRLVAATPALRVRIGIGQDTGDIVYRFASDERDIQLTDGSASAEELADAIDAATRRPFDIDDGPLARFAIVRHQADQAAVALIVHHLILDAASHVRITQRLARALTGSLEADDSRAYDDLVRRVRERETLSRDADRAYWFDRIEPVATAGDWLAKVEVKQGARASRRTMTFDAVDCDHLRALAASAGASLFQLLVAAVHHCLPAANEHTVLSAATSQRPRGPGYDDVIGCFVNEVPLLASRASSDSVPDLLERERLRWTEDLRRRNFPFADLAGQVRRHNGQVDALNTVMVGYRKNHRLIRCGNGIVRCSADLNFRYVAAKTALSVRLFDHHECLECEVVWSERLPEWAGDRFSVDLAAAVSGCARRRTPVEVMS